MSNPCLTTDEAELLGDWWDDGAESDLDWGLGTLRPVVERIIAGRENAARDELARLREAVEAALDGWDNGTERAVRAALMASPTPTPESTR